MSMSPESDQHPDSIIRRLLRNKAVSYAVVLATILGAIAGFTDTAEKLYSTFLKLFPVHVEQEGMVESFWIQIGESNDAMHIVNSHGELTDGTAARGDYVQILHPSGLNAIEDPLPLEVKNEGGSHVARKRPIVLPYKMLKDVVMKVDLYPILDVDEVMEPAGRTRSQRGGDCPRVIYMNESGETIDAKDAKLVKHTWARIQRTEKTFLNLVTDIAGTGENTKCN